jgi:hypothetical protein
MHRIDAIRWGKYSSDLETKEKFYEKAEGKRLVNQADRSRLLALAALPQLGAAMLTYVRAEHPKATQA